MCYSTLLSDISTEHSAACDKTTSGFGDDAEKRQLQQASEHVLQVILEPGDMLHVPKGMEHSAETVGTETVTFVDASRI